MQAAAESFPGDTAVLVGVDDTRCRRRFASADGVQLHHADYRAMFRPSGFVRVVPIQAETLVLWGEADPFLVPSLAQPNPFRAVAGRPPAQSPAARAQEEVQSFSARAGVNV